MQKPSGLGAIIAIIVLAVIIVQVIIGKPASNLEEEGLIAALALSRLT